MPRNGHAPNSVRPPALAASGFRRAGFPAHVEPEPVTSNWILAGGTWHDTGEWDDTESWED